MSILYRILGVIAKTNEFLGRYSYHFIKLNFILIVISILMLLIGWILFSNGYGVSKIPQKVEIKDLIDNKVNAKYITVEGVLYTDSIFQYLETDKKTGVKSVSKAWAPIFDKNLENAIMIELRDINLKSGSPINYSVTGLLWEIDEELKNELYKDTTSQFTSLNKKYMIGEGVSPENPIVGIIFFLVGIIIFVPFMITLILQNTIFQKSPILNFLASDIQSNTNENINILMSGYYTPYENNNDTAYFINIPTSLTIMNSGALVFLIDLYFISSSIFGKKTKYSGIWAIKIIPGSIRDIERGISYFGLKSYPAIRFSYKQNPDNINRKAVISCDNYYDREKMYTNLLGK